MRSGDQYSVYGDNARRAYLDIIAATEPRWDGEWPTQKEATRRGFLHRQHVAMMVLAHGWEDLHDSLCQHCYETRPIPYKVTRRSGGA